MQREHHRPLSEGQVACIEHDEFADSGALDIFHGIIVRGNINLYAAIIALAFSNGKGEKKIMVMLMPPKEQ